MVIVALELKRLNNQATNKTSEFMFEKGGLVFSRLLLFENFMFIIILMKFTLAFSFLQFALHPPLLFSYNFMCAKSP